LLSAFSERAKEDRPPDPFRSGSSRSLVQNRWRRWIAEGKRKGEAGRAFSLLSTQSKPLVSLNNDRAPPAVMTIPRPFWFADGIKGGERRDERGFVSIILDANSGHCSGRLHHGVDVQRDALRNSAP